MKIDDEFCERFKKSLPPQQIAWDDEKGLIPITEHWIGLMLHESLGDESADSLVRLVKGNIHLFQEYVSKAGSSANLSATEKSAAITELIILFCYKILKQAYEEEIDGY